ncbi:MAG: DUF4249 domain-containing protein [Ignavibacteriae bacterium]|nr:DUF4249 domain-containing protein [Ignavibacteriota bacterium]
MKINYLKISEILNKYNSESALTEDSHLNFKSRYFASLNMTKSGFAKMLIIFLFMILFISCEEVIELDLNSADPAIVIEANLTNSLDKNFVYITESTDFYNPGNYKLISGAEITITENNSANYILNEISPGKYFNQNLLAAPENQYRIDVNYNNKNFTAISSSPNPITIDSISYVLESRPFNKDKKFLELHVHFQDNPNQNDFARFIVYKNNEKLNGIFLYDDRLTNGNYIDFFFFNFDDEEFIADDLITVELQTIDEKTHTYFKTLRNARANARSGPFGSSAPANPETNWNNNALGYFSAFIVSEKSIVLN